MAKDRDITEEPEATLHDKLYEAGKSVADSVPWGPVAVFLYNKVAGDPVRERLKHWIEEIAEEVVRLRERNDDLDLSKLEEDPLFQTVLRRAAWAAINDHQKAKLKALRNAVLNSARSIDLDENRQLMFVNLIDRMTELHVRVLTFLADPKKLLREMGVIDEKGVRGGSLRPYLLEYFSIPESAPHSLTMVIRDLQASWLIIDDVYGDQTPLSLYATRLTAAGGQLVQFITNPLPEDELESSEP